MNSKVFVNENVPLKGIVIVGEKYDSRLFVSSLKVVIAKTVFFEFGLNALLNNNELASTIAEFLNTKKNGDE